MEKKKTTWYLLGKKPSESCLHGNKNGENCPLINHQVDGGKHSKSSEKENLKVDDQSKDALAIKVNSVVQDPANVDHKEVVLKPVDVGSNQHVKRVLQRTNHDLSFKAMNRRSKLLQELVETEQNYVSHLKVLVDDYMQLMKKDSPVPTPATLSDGKFRMIFGNVEAIYEFHRRFMAKEIQKSLERPSHLCYVFEKFQKKLNLYVVYSQNKDKSDFIVGPYLNNYFEEVRNYLGHELRLPDLLIKPIQRVMKYELLLSNLIKYTKEANIHEDIESLKKALDFMSAVPRTTNDMMVLSRLVNYEGSIMNHGKLIRQGFLMVSRHDLPTSPRSISLHFSFNSPQSTFKKRYVFLFEQIMIFCKVSSSSHFSNYIYKFHLNTSKVSVSILTCSEESQFNIHVKEPLGGDEDAGISLPIVCRAENIRMRQEWINDIQKILNLQNHFINALVSPTVYQYLPCK